MTGHTLHITSKYCRKMRSHKDLDAWKKSMDLVDSIYKVNKRFNIFSKKGSEIVVRGDE